MTVQRIHMVEDILSSDTYGMQVTSSPVCLWHSRRDVVISADVLIYSYEEKQYR